MQIRKETVRTLLVLLGSIVISIVCAYWFLAENKNVSRISLENITEVTEDVAHGIDNISIEEDKIYVRGWAVKEVPRGVNRTILLRNTNDLSEVWRINTILEKRTDIAEMYENGVYANAGFIASGKINPNMKNKEYEIIIYLNDYLEEVLFSTGKRVAF